MTGQQEAAETTLDQIEKIYGITLTERQRMLLTTQKALLDPLDQQRQFVLRMALAPCRCPACKAVICQVSASTGDWDTEMDRHTSDDAYACPSCQALLTWYLTFQGQQGFTLQPGQTITT